MMLMLSVTMFVIRTDIGRITRTRREKSRCIYRFDKNTQRIVHITDH